MSLAPSAAAEGASVFALFFLWVRRIALLHPQRPVRSGLDQHHLRQPSRQSPDVDELGVFQAPQAVVAGVAANAEAAQLAPTRPDGWTSRCRGLPRQHEGQVGCLAGLVRGFAQPVKAGGLGGAARRRGRWRERESGPTPVGWLFLLVGRGGVVVGLVDDSERKTVDDFSHGHLLAVVLTLVC